MTEEPDELTVGQLSDDLDFQHYADDGADGVWHDLQHLASVLRTLQFKTQPCGARKPPSGL